MHQLPLLKKVKNKVIILVTFVLTLLQIILRENIFERNIAGFLGKARRLRTSIENLVS